MRKKTGGKNFGSDNHKGGRKRLPEELKKLKRISRDEISRIINKLGAMSKDKLTAHLKGLNTPTIELMIGSIIVQAVQKGDYLRAEFLLSRTIGKVPDKIDLNDNTSLHSRIIKAMQIVEHGSE